MKIISICLSDLPKAKITEHKNGKKYISLVVDDRKEADQYGNDLTVYVNHTKEEREAKAAKVYVGQGKTYTFIGQAKQEAKPANAAAADEDDGLPF